MTNIKILCVDDQPANLVALDAALASTGYTLVHAGSGMDALYEITRHDFAAILLDVQMPEMDGFQTADAIRNIHGGKSIPIIFLTAIYPDDDYALMGYEAGAFDYLFKPLNPNVLRAKIAVLSNSIKKISS